MQTFFIIHFARLFCVWCLIVINFVSLSLQCISSPLDSHVDQRGGYHEYTEVRSCQDVVHLYHLLWTGTVLNIIALFLGIITAAVLGGFKDMVGSEYPNSLLLSSILSVRFLPHGFDAMLCQQFAGRKVAGCYVMDQHVC